ncbi:ParA family protein [Chitinibacteraceae bacterium HSL-7]
MTIIAVFNQKGGVGKTTVAANLAAALRRNGASPLVIDLDPQAHLTAMWGLKPQPSQTILPFYQGTAMLSDLSVTTRHGIDFIPSHIELSKVDTQVVKHKDHIWRLKLGFASEMLTGQVPIVIDCSPMLGPLAFSALFAADLVVVPVAADYLALNGAALLDKTLAGIGRYRPRLNRRYVINRYTPGQVTSEKVLSQLSQRYGKELMRTRIREQEVLGAAAGTGEDIFSFAPESASANDFSFMLDELVEHGLLRLQ